MPPLSQAYTVASYVLRQRIRGVKRYPLVLMLEPRFRPSKYLAFSVHMDGPREEHDLAVCRSGTYDIAVSAIRTAKKLGFRVTTNTTLFRGADPERMRSFFDEMMALGVEGMTISPGYSYEKAPDQDHFLVRRQTADLFRAILHRAKRSWRFNQTPLFLEFLRGNC